MYVYIYTELDSKPILCSSAELEITIYDETLSFMGREHNK